MMPKGSGYFFSYQARRIISERVRGLYSGFLIGNGQSPDLDRDVAPRNRAINYAPVARINKPKTCSLISPHTKCPSKQTLKPPRVYRRIPHASGDGFSNPPACALLFVRSAERKGNSRAKTQPAIALSNLNLVMLESPCLVATQVLSPLQSPNCGGPVFYATIA